MALTSIQMMHLADSALPVGGFAFSSGLEAAVKCGMVRTRPELVRYLKSCVEQWGRFELPFIEQFFREPGADVFIRYDRMMLAAPMRKASIAQARGWFRVLADLFPTLGNFDFKRLFREAGSAVHYLPLLTLCLKEAGASEAQVKELYLFTLLRDQISAAVRLGLIGPSAAQSIQSELEQGMGAVLTASGNSGENEAQRFTPMLEITQMLHPSLYIKLFQN
ncbi:urease accessory protein UreF [Pontiella agarivorans]|uniref:Urease accessory UreF family protein n=1 Tax=Pontiella agarivorans TaxID=3038953 RepID=A0ABU5MWW0_9BACT|nr:urease accessory UreF family protein [Pontiella agarivorans]MDZ8118546.1 urease accessory UreF family protein [Pontiella agarivorans]